MIRPESRSPHHFPHQHQGIIQPGSAVRASSTSRVGRSPCEEAHHLERHHPKSTRQARSLSPRIHRNLSHHLKSSMQLSPQRSMISRQPSWPEVLEQRSQRTMSREGLDATMQEDGRSGIMMDDSKSLQTRALHSVSPADNNHGSASVSSSIAKVAGWQCHEGEQLQDFRLLPQACTAPDCIKHSI
eukprot:scaffold67823_cov16-Tisochrysis_lutea.AAC.1